PKISSQTLADITHATKGGPTERTRPDEVVASNGDDVLTMPDLMRELSAEATVNDVGNILSKHLRNLIPGSLYVLYLYNAVAGELIGVVSVYSASPEAFTEDHRRLLEVLAPQLSRALKGTSATDAPSRCPTLPRTGRRSQEHERDSIRNDPAVPGITMTVMF